MRYFIVFFVTLLSNGSILAQITPTDIKDQITIVDFAQNASIRALDFIQGDITSLMDAQDDFVPKGWNEFMKDMDGWLDDKGAPKFSSNFIPSGKALDISGENGMLRLTIPGILKQQSQNAFGGVSTTTYRAEIDVQMGGNPVKIEHLEQRTCGGASTVTSCR